MIRQALAAALAVWAVGCSKPVEETAASASPPPDLQGAPIDAGAPAAEPAAEPEPGPRANGPVQEAVLDLTFERLANYEFEGQKYLADGPTPLKPNQIPPEVLAMAGKTVRLRGFMIPLEFAGDKVEYFILSRYFFTCCYGTQPDINEWVEVRLAGGSGIDPPGEQLIEVTGELKVGEKMDDQGYLISIYQMAGRKVREP